MIAKLKGTVTEVFPGFIVLDVQGVGYKVEGDFLNVLVSSELDIYIYTHVREQEIRLFGFNTRSDFILFEKLIQISGVGPKAAMTLITNVGTDQIFVAISEGEPNLLKTTGVGVKTAQRIIIEMKNKIDKLGITIKAGSQMSISNLTLISEVEEALVDLGYNKKHISEVISKMEIEGKSSVELIREALKLLSK